MNEELLKYLRSIDGKPLSGKHNCNTITAHILTKLHPEIKSDLNEVIFKLESCKTLFDIRKVIKEDNRTAIKYLELYGYKETNDNRILEGDFLIKERKYFNDCVYMIDSITKVGLQNYKLNDETIFVQISKDIHISKEHKIYRR